MSEDLRQSAEALAKAYAKVQQKAKALEAEQRIAKEEFEDAMMALTDSLDVKRVTFECTDDDELAGQSVVVTRVEKANIEWFPEKLERRVPKDILRRILKKRYIIRDMKGLARYLKSCGVDPDEFRRYVTVEKSVDQEAVDRLSKIGELEVKHVSGCYYVHCQKPYFRVTVKRSDGGNDGG